MIGNLDHIQIVFDDDDGVPAVHELLQYRGQTVDVGDVQSGRRLVQNIDGLSGCPFGQFGRQLDALGLAAGERRGGLSELDISETDFLQGTDFSRIFGWFSKKTTASSIVISRTSLIFLPLYRTSSVSRL